MPMPPTSSDTPAMPASSAVRMLPICSATLRDFVRAQDVEVVFHVGFDPVRAAQDIDDLVARGGQQSAALGPHLDAAEARVEAEVRLERAQRHDDAVVEVAAADVGALRAEHADDAAGQGAADGDHLTERVVVAE